MKTASDQIKKESPGSLSMWKGVTQLKNADFDVREGA